MDPLSLAGSFATLVGLLANYKSEHSSQKLPDFMQWLKDNHQSHVAKNIQLNEALSKELSSVLTMKHNDLVFRITSLHHQLAIIASKIDGLSGLSRILGQKHSLSLQAASIISQLVNSGTTRILEWIDNTDTAHYMSMDDSIGHLNLAEPQFVIEDFDKLLACGLLRLERGPHGEREFIPTRAAHAFVGTSQDA
jgi:hypothetical protein